jgi:hypothetical protein
MICSHFYKIPDCSIAVSIKMNVLLFAPALGAILLIREGLWRSIGHGFTFVLVQVRGTNKRILCSDCDK